MLEEGYQMPLPEVLEQMGPRHGSVQMIVKQADTGWNKVAVANLHLNIGKGFMLSEAFLPEFQSLKTPILHL